MQIIQTIWDYVPTTNQPLAFILAFSIAGMAIVTGWKMMRNARRQ